MGQTISNLVEGLQNNAEKEKMANDSLNSLVEMAKLQKEQFYLAVLSNVVNSKDIPINKVIARDSILQATVTSKPTDVGAIISDNFTAFASGDVATGIGKLVNAGLNILLGSYSGSTSSRDQYVITTGALGGITRIDMHFFAYRYTSSQLTEICKQVISVCIVVSSVDASKLDDGTLKNIVQIVYGSLPIEDQKKILAQFTQAIKDDREDSKPSPSHAALVSHVARAVRATNTGLTQASSTDGGSGGSGGSNGGSAPPVNKTEKQKFSVRTPIGEASKSASALEAFLRGGIVEAYTQHQTQQEPYAVSVLCEKPDDSTSDSVINGEVEVVSVIKQPDVKPVELWEVIENLLGRAENQALSELPITAFDLISN